eukprot:COSAG01_NODE_51649_length_353_cov_0.688976_2_plen_51_part_01
MNAAQVHTLHLLRVPRPLGHPVLACVLSTVTGDQVLVHASLPLALYMYGGV